MPIIKSAKKRVRVAGKAAARNSKTKRNLRTSLKLLAKSPSVKSHSSAVSNIDKSLKKGVLHKNKAARLKKQAAKNAKAAGVKPAKAAPKKTTAKKAPVKKASAKKK
jgi:small subunit ribosomal protein S20